MTELLMRKEGDQEGSQLQQLDGSEIHGMPLEKALKVVETGSDELVSELLNQHPWVLKYESVAFAIIKDRGDEVSIRMIETYPQILKYESVAWAIGNYGGDKLIIYITEKHPEILEKRYVTEAIVKRVSDDVCINMIEKRPELLKYVADVIAEEKGDEVSMYIIVKHPEILNYAASAIAKYRSDNVAMHMLKTHPEVLKYEGVASTIAKHRSDKVAMYMLEKYPEALEYKEVAEAIAENRGNEVCMYMLKTHPEVLKHDCVASAVAKYRSTYILENHPELLDGKYVAKAIAEYGYNEVCIYMLETHPEVLKYEGVASTIAKHRSDKVAMYMLEKYPEVLDYKEVAEAIAENRGDEVCMYMLKTHPEVLKYEGVASTIAKHRSDKVAMYMLETHPEILKYESVVLAIARYRGEGVCMYMLEKHPEILGMERSRMEKLLYNLANANKSEALTYILLMLEEIKPNDFNDLDLIASQFSVILPALSNPYKEEVIRRIFLDKPAISYIKELDSMGPIYRTLLEMLNVSEESVKKLAKELSKAEGNVRKALPLRGLAYTLNGHNSEMLNPFIKNSRSVMDALKIFPSVRELMFVGIISNSEFKQISDSIDKEAELSKLLMQKVEQTFNVKVKSDDAISAILDSNFLKDLFVLYAKYHQYNEKAENILINVVKHYFEGGIEEFKKFKFGGHELAKEQLSDAYSLKDKLMDLDKLKVTYTTNKFSISYESIKNELYKFMQHKEALLSILDEVEDEAEKELFQIAKSTKSEELAKLLKAKDLAGLTSHKFDLDDEKVKSKGIALIRLLNAKKSLSYIDNIAEELKKIPENPKEEQDHYIAAIANKVRDLVNNEKILESLKILNKNISRINEEQSNGINKGELCNALTNTISMVGDLLKYSKKAKEVIITAQITFDPSKILTFGRYGSSGVGNCQKSDGEVRYNQGLMSILVDANQFMIIFWKANSIEPLGFMQVHLLKSKEKGMIFFMEEPYTNEPDKIVEMKEAAWMLAQKIKNETGIDCFTYGGASDENVRFEVVGPRSYVSRYIDFGSKLEEIPDYALKGPESFQYEISAKCLTSHPLFGLKR